MQGIQAALESFFSTPAGAMVVALFALSILDLALGVLGAVRDRVFQWGAIDAWVRRTLAGRLLPVTLLLITGHLLGGLALTGDVGSQLTSPGAWLTSAGIAAGATVLAATVASIAESLQAKPGTREVPED